MCVRSKTTYTPCNHTVSRVTEPCDTPGPGCGSTTSGATPPAAPSPSEDCPTCKELKDEEASILAELEAAIAANPDLKAEKPKSAEPQWEDYEAAIADNPDFAAPVATNREKKYYSLKEKWECGHEGTPYQTAIERDGGDDDKEGLLISDIKGICPACMEKWTKLEEDTGDVAGGSGGPPGLPTYNDTWSDDGKDFGKNKVPGDISEDDELPSSRTRFGRETNLDDHDESPFKGKGAANAPGAAGVGDRSKSPAPYSDYGDDASSIAGSDISDTPGKQKKQVQIYDSGDSDSDNNGKGNAKPKNGRRFDDDSEDDYSDDMSFSGSDTNENTQKKRRAFFKLGSK